MKVSIKQYSQTLLELTENKSESEIFDIVQSFAEQLKKDGQLKNSSKIIEKFSEIYNAANGIVEVTVTTSRSLSSDQADKIESYIKEKYSAKEVLINNVVDEKIKGGIVIRVGDEIIDGSIEAQLKRLQKELAR
ncbi:MAG: F0F1 ATP synthase subunit delta [Candidatus Moranbacteria bacterium GW2011_GWC2_37_8]|nr:MAG: F0F1 ATP synthase subunit delta [Candidatus Moranbacteria bacterium GW2011_GWC2_37_8]KKQ60694.1 MAG: F0F1 ATP synthase subunit delta [Parcubacteria group bacterium GW2011_GWC1_38_22]